MNIICHKCIFEEKEEIFHSLQWSGNTYGNGYEVEMDGNGGQFLKIVWIGLDLGEGPQLKTIRDTDYQTFIKHDIINTEAWLYPKNTYSSD